MSLQLPELPETLLSATSSLFQELESFEQIDLGKYPAELKDSLAKVFVCSEFVARHCLRQPELLQTFLESGILQKDFQQTDYVDRLNEQLSQVNNPDELHRYLRQFRLREWIRIVWRDIAGFAELEQTTRELSWLAETCVDGALQKLYQWACEEWGTPCNADGEPQQLVVIGMGKLGAWELNVSSDIDLIFTYPEAGETHGGKKELSNSEFFIRLGQKLIQSLDNATVDGFVFRVDMRLRPFGDGGALAMSFDAMENYYQVHGREWERYAMIKARVIAGDRQAGETLMAMLKPFIYRRYIDFGAYESLREMKVMINREVKRKGIDGNVKLGPGGIREVEFIGQVFQLIRGGREKELQERNILKVLELLKAKAILPDYVVDELAHAYRFLRHVEHRIQEFAEQQTHELPADETGQQRLAYGMGFSSWDLFYEDLQGHRSRVQSHFEQVFEAPQTEHAEHDELDLTRLWYGRLDSETAEKILADLGYQEPKQILAKLAALHNSRKYREMSTQGQERLDKAVPLLIGAIGKSTHPDITFGRVAELIESVARRTVYLVLLIENPLALSQLVRLCAASPWIARYLAQHPMLLDELMDTRRLYAPPDKEQLAREIRERLEGVDPGDVEQQMDTLRHFHHLNLLRVAAADIVGSLPLMKVSDHLSWIAEVCLEETLELAWQYMVDKHGQLAGSSKDSKGFAIIGYGKLGGLELGYGSDLDLVFIHHADNLSQMTDGKQAVEASVFFARLGQRLIHLLTAVTRAGILYEVDMRLRPDGASGMLVSGLKSFTQYQLEKAWTWEHQALVRARFVAGDPAVGDQFNSVRADILGEERDCQQLHKDVLEMRDRMRGQLDKSKQGLFDLKQGRGGIVDIEFMVQYGVLAFAHKYPELRTWTDNIRLLMVMAAGRVMSPEQVDKLTEAYKTYRGRVHRLKLDEQSGLVPENEYMDLRESIIRVWDEWMLKQQV
ncbi:MAG: bifunctional [glutamate--ammonia ligase]-adenylyl-L-tyrosine phosphorylase/[glutamate--ammonia-ligase] adenylyltransferase [Gammaproteobacteria bacterium]|nr:bifunctional [glutamate--ammonia ligase]-adenylyl-L-tyrosine phosphorylase/[glutamate--ammonia-ligase] adenylyltransferase [Gammaproteobacteria bacterium]